MLLERAHQVEDIDAVLVNNRQHLAEIILWQHNNFIATELANVSYDGETVDVAEGQQPEGRHVRLSILSSSCVLNNRHLQYVANDIVMGDQYTFLHCGTYSLV